MEKSKKVKNFILELLFPSFCLGCQKEGTLLCQDCFETLEITEFDYCLCSKDPVRIPNNIPNAKCAKCQDKKLSGLYFALSYAEKVLTRKLIHQFKYEPYIKNLAKPLAKVLARHFILNGKNTAEFWENAVLVPVPLEINKQKKRGYNQSEELAKEFSKIVNIPVIANNLVKTKKTRPQMELSAKERAENLQGAFLVKNPEELEDRKVFLVDDVYTTGSTMEECAKTLKAVGVKQVFGIVVAREG